MKLNPLCKWDLNKCEDWIGAKIKKHQKFRGSYCSEVSENKIECGEIEYDEIHCSEIEIACLLDLCMN